MPDSTPNGRGGLTYAEEPCSKACPSLTNKKNPGIYESSTASYSGLFFGGILRGEIARWYAVRLPEGVTAARELDVRWGKRIPLRFGVVWGPNIEVN